MLNPFFNAQEQRLRALLRILLFLFVFALAIGLPTLLPVAGLDYVLQILIALGLFWFFTRIVDRRPWNESGLVPERRWWWECGAGVVIAALVMGLIFLTEWLFGGLTLTGYGWERSGQQFWLIPILLFLLRMLAVGVYEEIMMRGYLIPNITEGVSLGRIQPGQAALIALVISSAIFGVAHATNPNATLTAVVNIFLAGVMLAIPFLITGRLALSIGIHFSWNFFQGGIFGFRVSGLEVRNSVFQIQQGGPSWWTGGEFGPEAGLIGVLGILLIIAITLLYLKQSGLPLKLHEQFGKTNSEG